MSKDQFSRGFDNFVRSRPFNGRPAGTDSRSWVLWQLDRALFHGCKLRPLSTLFGEVMGVTALLAVAGVFAVWLFGILGSGDVRGLAAAVESMSSFWTWLVTVLVLKVIDYVLDTRAVLRRPQELRHKQELAVNVVSNGKNLAFLLLMWLMIPLAQWSATAALALPLLLILLYMNLATQLASYSGWLAPTTLCHPQGKRFVIFHQPLVLLVLGIALVVFHGSGVWGGWEDKREVVFALYLALPLLSFERSKQRSEGRVLKYLQRLPLLRDWVVAQEVQDTGAWEDREQHAFEVVQKCFDLLCQGKKTPLVGLLQKTGWVRPDEGLLSGALQRVEAQESCRLVWKVLGKRAAGEGLLFEVATFQVNERGDAVAGRTVVHLMRLDKTQEAWRVRGWEVLASD